MTAETEPLRRRRPLFDDELGAFLAKTASETPVPGAAAAAVLAASTGAALVAMVARRSRADWGNASGVLAQAETLRARLGALADTGAEAYEAALSLMSERPADERGSRDAALGSALARAADVGVQIGERAADVAALAELAAECGDQSVRAEAVAGALLGEAAARASTAIVRLNLVMRPEDERVIRALAAAESASSAARRAASAT